MSQAYGQFATVYDQLMADMPYDQWLQFAKQAWSRYGEPSTIVDLGCGTGTIAVALAHSGYDVTGIDLSNDMLSIAADKWKHMKHPQGKLQLLEQNMCSWSIHGQVDSVISFCDSLNYVIDEDELLSTLYATYEGLKPRGTFIFDVHPVWRFEQYAEEQPFIYDEDGISYLWSSDYDEEEHIIQHDLAIFAIEQDGRYRRIDEQHVQRAYHSQWLVSALKSVGFSEVHGFSDFELIEQHEQSQRLFFVAIK